MGIGNTLTSGGLGLIGAELDRQHQKEMQERAHGFNMEETEHAAGLNYMYNEMAANAADERTRSQFNDLYSPEARVQQLKNAGLSVGLMYGTGGTVGQGQASGAQGGGASGQQGKSNSAMVNGLGLAQIMSNVRLNESMAKKNEAEAEEALENANEKRGGNPMGQTIIENIKADTGVKEADRALKFSQMNLNNALTTAKELENAFNTDAYDTKLEMLKYQTSIAFQDLQEVIRNNEIGEATKATKIKQFEAQLELVQNQAFEALTKAGLNQEQIKLTQETCKKVAQEISESRSRQGFMRAQTSQRGQEIQLSKQELDFAYKKVNAELAQSQMFKYLDINAKMNDDIWSTIAYSIGVFTGTYDMQNIQIQK